MSNITEKEFKDILFEVYSAGFEAGYTQKIDIKTGFLKYYETIIKELQK